MAAPAGLSPARPLGRQHKVPDGDLLGLVLAPRHRGHRRGVGREADSVRVRVRRVVWHDLVMESLNRDWFGLENLSLIPGSISWVRCRTSGRTGWIRRSASESLEAVEIATGESCTFDHAECASAIARVFPGRALKGQIRGHHVTFRLSPRSGSAARIWSVRQNSRRPGCRNPTRRRRTEAVIVCIRRSKLPDPAVIGNAGSFFKNPVLTGEAFEALKAAHPEVPESVLARTGWDRRPAGSSIRPDSDEGSGTHGVRPSGPRARAHRGGAAAPSSVILPRTSIRMSMLDSGWPSSGRSMCFPRSRGQNSAV